MKDCEHRTTEERRRKKSNDVVVIVEQCLECGRSRGERSKEGRNLESLAWFDPTIRERWEAQERKESEERRKQWLEDHQNRTGQWWESYKDYLESDHWDHVRRAVLRRDVICQKCFTKPATEAHHLTYETFSKRGFSYPAECVGLCHGCHEEETEASRQGCG